MIRADGEKGFVHNVPAALTPDQASAAYHHNMNQDNYQK
jgi:hypothetical protein